MKKIVSNVLVVSIQLIIGGLFLFMLFFNNDGDNNSIAVNNNNLDKMADAVSLLFTAEESKTPVLEAKSDNKEKEEELITAEQKKAEEEAARKKAEEEAKEKAKKEAEEAARKKAEEEAARKKAEEEARQAAVLSSNQSTAALQQYARSLVIDTYGWSEGDFSALVNLWNKESGWSVTAGNSSSGAYGIPQSLPGSKMASEGSDWATNGQTQIRWGLKYIKNTYGSPSAAWGHFCSVGWY